MEVKVISAGFVEVHQKDLVDFNTWYDFDHVPEWVSQQHVIAGRRYVATPECKALRAPSQIPELPNAGASYLTTYLLHTDDLAVASANSRAKTEEIKKRKGLFRSGKVVRSSMFRMQTALARKGIPVSAAAIPFLGHRGVYAALTHVADPAARPQVDRWFAETHASDLFGIPGFAAAMRLAQVDAPGYYMNLYLLDRDPVATLQDFRKQSAAWPGGGRFPGGASTTLFSSPYELIAPGRYDFRTEVL